MKKFYFLSMMVVLLVSIVPTNSVNAQASCPLDANGNPKIPAVFNESWFDPITGNQICAVYIYNMWPNSRVRLSGPGGAPINSVTGQIVFTDTAGYSCFVYPCTATPLQVSTCNGALCCTAPVPVRSALPIKLKNFNSRLLNDQQVQLNWVTSVEVSSMHYDVEKSLDGVTFTKVGTIAAAGNSDKDLSYSFSDNIGNNAVAFYRLKQVDIDGRYIYTKVIYVNNKRGSGRITRIFPNPFRTDVQLIGINTSELTRNNVRIFNAMGQEVAYEISGTNAISIKGNPPSGVYILRVKDQTFKLVKE